MGRWMAMLGLAASLAATGCGSPSSDGDADADSDDDSDGILECGDERAPEQADPQPVVNGSDSWDRTVVDLSSGQAMALGAMMVREPMGWGPSCTATLVAPRVVVTAAHCVIQPAPLPPRTLSPDVLRFAVGRDVARPDALLEVSEVASHPEYRRSLTGNAEHDVGILVLESDATTTVEGIEPIALNCEPVDAETLVGRDVQNGGYGSTTPTPGEEVNTRRYWTVEEVTAVSDFDITVYGHGVSAVCHGDSGGPSLVTMPDGVIRTIGVASWGDASCVDYNHYARVDDNCELIRSFFEGCLAETEEGRCVGDRAIYCEGGAVVSVDCAATGRACGDDGTGRVRCVEQGAPCDGETFEGRCEDGAAVWCDESGLVRRAECGDLGMSCGDDGSGNMRCLEGEPCGDLDWSGRCEGDDALWCQGGVTRARRCADCGQVCGWSEVVNGYYCL